MSKSKSVFERLQGAINQCQGAISSANNLLEQGRAAAELAEDKARVAGKLVTDVQDGLRKLGEPPRRKIVVTRVRE